ncbi:hypothetical protein IM660_10815 [Ruania alkalisoli]|uniref:Uncharacterized protein n=1 Tax=Ruania alkalisoli TaxID=2779775 RepID=A0A7M1SRJ6_9MICO|nr:hypothetical protein [Ruania alkalisoli]QOR69213.1 hypothetical protein IM660_10815 [Ruania alkalisoli]
MGHRFNPPPGWPTPPPGWEPPEGWQPDPTWPPAPQGWQFWVPDGVPSAPVDAGGTEAPAPGGAQHPPVPQASAPSPFAPAEPQPTQTQPAEPQPVEGDSASVPEEDGRAEADAGLTSETDPVAGPPAEQHTEQLAQPTEQLAQPTEQFPASAPQSGVPGYLGGAGTPGQAGSTGAPDSVTGAGHEGFAPGQGGAAQPYPQGQFGQQAHAHSSGQFSSSSQPGPSGFDPSQPQAPVPGQYAPADGAARPYTASYAAAPAPGSSGPWGQGPAGSAAPGPGGPPPGGPGQKKSRTGLIIGVVVLIAVVVIGGIALALSLIFGGEDEPEPVVEPTSTSEPTDDPTTSEPTDEPTTDEPTEEPTQEPTDDGGGSGALTGDYEVLSPSDPAIVTDDGTPIVEVRLLQVERNWQPDPNSFICAEAEGEYVAMEFEFTTLPELADYSEGTWSFSTFELGLLDTGGNKMADISAFAGLFCLDESQQAPSDMSPGETYTGWALMDAPREPGGILWEPWLDFTGEVPTYAWDLADF